MSADDFLILETNNHSVFSLNYHLVLVIKYRKKVIDDNISNSLKEIFEYIAPKYNINLVEWNHDEDYCNWYNKRVRFRQTKTENIFQL